MTNLTLRNKAYFHVSTNLEPVNSLSLHLVYGPAMGSNAIMLYHLLTEFYNRNNLLRANTPIAIDELLTFLGLDFQEFDDLRSQLETFNLLQTGYSQDKNGSYLYHFELLKPLSLEEIMKNQKLILLIKKQLGARSSYIMLNVETLLGINKNNSVLNNRELFNISADMDEALSNSNEYAQEFFYENGQQVAISASLSQMPVSDHISNEIKTEFYSNIYATLKKPFGIDQNIWALINKYAVEQKILSISRLSTLAYKSIVQRKGKINISYDNFSILINEELFGDDDNDIQAKIESYKEYWKSCVEVSGGEFVKNAKKLFGNVSPENIYYFYYSKVPTKGIKTWISDTHALGFTIPTINAILSFVHTWINNINAGYLKKLIKTLVQNENYSLRSVLNHLKDVIVKDYEEKNNKLNIVPTKQSINLKNLAEKPKTRKVVINSELLANDSQISDETEDLFADYRNNDQTDDLEYSKNDNKEDAEIWNELFK
ncbi:hypothetical protein J2Z62_000237 [Mycoplasmoides fastidiosum]|uniref:Replicative helicase loading/DNA remodeling protein DnaB N-terminal winged helix domain-containing protein n=1 Tax=Mycoplasmoides fastidiosum TaxID=92758 RepID=A0ABU0LYK9_9BACT|nr:hypothetical protein [Mycoplasmoides fastidiosum]MDQ0513799.1 hypothetical protein [Mycoplasmoides fastidiosum]UUD37783.1 hypothetical protein NPA10_00065 [Mycoplasmoides fastidiosum]